MAEAEIIEHSFLSYFMPTFISSPQMYKLRRKEISEDRKWYNNPRTGYPSPAQCMPGAWGKAQHLHMTLLDLNFSQRHQGQMHSVIHCIYSNPYKRSPLSYITQKKLYFSMQITSLVTSLSVTCLFITTLMPTYLTGSLAFQEGLSYQSLDCLTQNDLAMSWW